MLPIELKSALESVCRIGLGANNPAFQHQVERLATTLREAGYNAEAASLKRLLTNTRKTATIQPSRVEVAQAFADTEALTPQISVPADKETAVPLAEIRFPQAPPMPYPILESEVDHAVRALAQEWKNSDRLAKLGVHPAQSCLLYGLPGTGKTQVAHALADELELPMVLARLDGLVSSFLGTTARNIANLFQFANRYRCILLLDEFDAVAKLRDDPHEVGEIKRVVNSVLQNLDLRKGKGITVAITNHEQLLDPAIWRRFESRIQITPPAYPARVDIVRRFFAPVPLDATNEAVIAWATEGMTGSDLETLARSVKRSLALHPGSHVIDALRHSVRTNSSGGQFPNFAVLLQPIAELARQLSTQPSLKFTQRDIARFLGTNQAKISRLVRQTTVPTHEPDE